MRDYEVPTSSSAPYCLSVGLRYRVKRGEDIVGEGSNVSKYQEKTEKAPKTYALACSSLQCLNASG